MKLENQVCSLDLAKRLKELGVKQDASIFEIQKYSLNEKPMIMFVGALRHQGLESAVLSGELEWRYAAFTVAELGEMLPKVENLVTMFFENGRCQICLQGNIENDDGIATRWGAAGQSIEADTEADARAKMLVYLLENKLVIL